MVMPCTKGMGLQDAHAPCQQVDSSAVLLGILSVQGVTGTLASPAIPAQSVDSKCY